MADENTQENIALTVNDLQAIVTIIDTASDRGAFKGNELMAVGSIYNKVTTFIAAATAQQAVDGDTTKPPTTEEHNTAMDDMAEGEE